MGEPENSLVLRYHISSTFCQVRIAQRKSNMSGKRGSLAGQAKQKRAV